MKATSNWKADGYLRREARTIAFLVPVTQCLTKIKLKQFKKTITFFTFVMQLSQTDR